MNKEVQVLHEDLSQLAEDARALLLATAEAAGEEVEQARQRLAAALERSREVCARVRQQACQGAQAADRAVRGHPYQAIGIAFGLGALIGYLARCRCSLDDTGSRCDNTPD